MTSSGRYWLTGLARVGLVVLAVLPAVGCGAAGMLAISLAGGAAAVSGEPQRATNTQG